MMYLIYCRLLRIFGCPHQGCPQFNPAPGGTNSGNSLHAPPSGSLGGSGSNLAGGGHEALRSQAISLLSRLLWYDKGQFKKFIGILVNTREMPFLLSFLHGYLGFCLEPVNPCPSPSPGGSISKLFLVIWQRLLLSHFPFFVFNLETATYILQELQALQVGWEVVATLDPSRSYQSQLRTWVHAMRTTLGWLLEFLLEVAAERDTVSFNDYYFHCLTNQNRFPRSSSTTGWNRQGSGEYHCVCLLQTPRDQDHWTLQLAKISGEHWTLQWRQSTHELCQNCPRRHLQESSFISHAGEHTEDCEDTVQGGTGVNVVSSEEWRPAEHSFQIHFAND